MLVPFSGVVTSCEWALAAVAGLRRHCRLLQLQLLVCWVA